MRLVIPVILISGCAKGPTEPGPDPCETAQSLRTSAGFMTVAEEADIAARSIPGGFGGLYQELGASSNGFMVAFYKDTSFTDEKKTTLRRVLLCQGAYPGWAGRFLTTELFQIAVRIGQYTATELLTYLNRLEPLTRDPSVWALEVDPEKNRVWIGLAENSQRARIEQLVSTQAVPLEAVIIEGPPPTSGSEQFEPLMEMVETVSSIEDLGTFGFAIKFRFTNRQNSLRYPDWCVDPDPDHFTAYFAYVLEKWDGTQWRFVKGTPCVSILLPPRTVTPGESVTDSIPVAAARRLNAFPAWLTARITGTYRLVGRVYTSTTPDPGAHVTDPAPAEEQVSKPFRIVNRASY